MIIKHIIVFFLVLLTVQMHGQNEHEALEMSSIKYSGEGVVVKQRLRLCEDAVNGKKQYNVILSIENTSNQIKEFSFSLEKQYNTYCVGCGSDSEQIAPYLYILEPLQVIEGACFDQNNGLSFVSRIIAPGAQSSLVSFELKNLIITNK